jgi:hypothetical protein
MTAVVPSDLIALVADKSMEMALKGLLARPEALAIGHVRTDVQRHPEKDCGCRSHGATFLSPFAKQYRRALLMFDYEGCGEQNMPVVELEESLERELAHNGWLDRSAVIILDPELEIWVWSNSPHVADVLGWAGRTPPLREWLAQERLWPSGLPKPERPKETLEAALREVKEPRTSSLYEALAGKVSLEGCMDRAFLKLKSTLQGWFPAGHAS